MNEDVASFFTQLGLSALSVLMLLFLALLFSAYVKIVTALGVLRVGLGHYSLPSAFICSGLALVLTFFVMYPTLRDSSAAVDRVLRSRVGPISDTDRASALNAGIAEWKGFLVRHSAPEERLRFSELARKLDAKATDAKGEKREDKAQADAADSSWRIVAPAFLLTELKRAFSVGITIFLPFLVIDLVIVSAMVALGTDRLSPQLVALPLKLLLFVLVDGWGIITTNLITGYMAPIGG